jgi:hypothetical protein
VPCRAHARTHACTPARTSHARTHLRARRRRHRRRRRAVTVLCLLRRGPVPSCCRTVPSLMIVASVDMEPCRAVRALMVRRRRRRRHRRRRRTVLCSCTHAHSKALIN